MQAWEEHHLFGRGSWGRPWRCAMAERLALGMHPGTVPAIGLWTSHFPSLGLHLFICKMGKP